MTDHRSPLDAALDLVLYAPVGLALTLSEELPKLAAKGRNGLGARVTTARVVGQFAVAQGRNEVRRRMGSERPGTAAGSPPAPSGANGSGPHPAPPAATAPSPAAPSPAAPSPAAPSPAASSSTAAPTAAASPAAPSSTASSSTASAPTGSSSTASSSPVSSSTAPAANRPSPAPASGAKPAAGAKPAVADLAIPGYDSLSASQVVQRLAGLSGPELQAVKEYESASRGRRTILARVGQLQGQ